MLHRAALGVALVVTCLALGTCLGRHDGPWERAAPPDGGHGFVPPPPPGTGEAPAGGQCVDGRRWCGTL